MTKLNHVYKCPVCGNIVQMVHAADGELVCCNQPMVLQRENSVDASEEKHVPVIEKIDSGYKVTVGSVEHPMDPNHYIEWIELIGDGKSYRHFLQPGDNPSAEFCVKSAKITARDYCNLHGLWQA